MARPARDHRSTAQLFRAATRNDEDAACEAVAALHWRGSREVLDQATHLTLSDDPDARRRGADILSQLGLPERTFPDECFAAVHRLLRDAVPDVVSSALYALHHIDAPRTAADVARFAEHGNRDIGFGVAFALNGVDTALARTVLLGLLTDEDGGVRDWATFGIARQVDTDTAEIRAALTAALSDNDADVRYEAVLGLARRGDTGAVTGLMAILLDDPDDVFGRDAATVLLGWREARSTTAIIKSLRDLDHDA